MILPRLAALSVFAWALLGAFPALAAPPNIVLIMADDLGATDLGCFGSKFYESPNLDRLAAQGMRFTAAYSCGPNCVPTRAALMSGQYSPRTGIFTVGDSARGQEQFRKLKPVPNRTALPSDAITMAEALRNAGYATAMFGKWHLGEGQSHPSKQGFDEAIVSMGRHFGFRTSPPQPAKEGEYLADFLTDRAVDFIARQKPDLGKQRPFFLFLSQFVVHSPWDAKPELVERFKNKAASGGHREAAYAAMILSLDESVGRVMAAMEEHGLAENTLVVFVSDNGGVGGYGNIGGRNITDNAPLRGGKGMLYEGGIRVPMIARWPGVVRGGSTCDVPVASIDFFPTFLEVAGRSPAESIDGAKLVLDGESLVRLLRSSGSGALKRDTLYWHFPCYLEANVQRGTWRTTPAGALRSGDYKLIEFFETGAVELYNLRDDPGETKDLSRAQPEKTADLTARLRGWRKQLGAPMPTAK
jgi:arylsulfatase A-like enzyme